MHLYFAGGENTHWYLALKKAEARCGLYSYYYLTKELGSVIKLSEVEQEKVFLDSGGYSAFTKGAKIDIGHFCGYIKEHSSIITAYAVLDVIGDFRKTIANQRVMEKAELKPIPAFHFGCNLDDLRSLVKEYDYIALGGLVPLARRRPTLFAWLDKCFSIIKNDAKVHGFGATGCDLLKKYPFYSVDSTSYLGGSMRSEIYSFNSESGHMDIIRTSIKEKASYQSIRFSDDSEKKKWYERVIQNIKEWIKFEDYVTQLWAKRGITWQ